MTTARQPKDSTASGDRDSLHQVLLVDDEPAFSAKLQRILLADNTSLKISTAATASGALSCAKNHTPDVVVADLSLCPKRGPESGLALITALRRQHPATRILALTGHGADEYGYRALSAGANSFLQKPVSKEFLCSLVRDGVQYARLKRSYSAGTTEKDVRGFSDFESLDPSMQSAVEEARFAASNFQPVLILGETGTGKSKLAAAIHRASSRNQQDLLRFYPSAAGADLTASQLFGHLQGAFTGATQRRNGLIAEADGGSLFIDEVDNLPQATQITLLEVLQSGSFTAIGADKGRQSDFRLITATNRSRNTLLAPDALREDFYHRVACIVISLPPLRERRSDIPLLLNRLSESLPARLPLNDAFEGFLCRHPLPGNVRQLKMLLEKASARAAFRGDPSVGLQHLSPEDRLEAGIGSTIEAETISNTLNGNLNLKQQVQNLENSLVRQALMACENNKSEAARTLGIDRKTLQRIAARL